MFVEGVRGPQASAAVRQVARRRSAAGFEVGAPAPAEEPQAVSPALELGPLEGLLALQEREAGAASEREVRRFGHAVLGELTKLQAGMLSPAGVARADLQRLAGLCAHVPYTEDATLRTLLQAVVLRARIELARG